MVRPRNTLPAAPRPWVAEPHVNGLIPVHTVAEPIVEACLVPINGNLSEAEANASLIQYWSECDAAGLIP